MVRWDEPIEAAGMDGRVARATMVDLMDHWWALVFIDELEAATRVAPNGHAPGTGWVIRNVAQPAGELSDTGGQLPSPEIVWRMVALVREAARNYYVAKEARAILAELEPVDGDLVEARELVESFGDALPRPEDIARAAIRRGRELERGA